MSHAAWDGPDIAAFWDYAEQHAAKVLSEADLHHAVSQALALVKDEPPYVPLVIAITPPNPGDQYEIEDDEPDDQPDETLPAWGALIRSGLRVAGKGCVVVVL